MVPRRLWLSKRSIGRGHVGRRHERGVLRPVARANELAAGFAPGGLPLLSVVVITVATVSAILTILYAFQQDDWRTLLSFSSAENASIAVAALGAAMLFRSERINDLAGLAWTVALLHLAGHALAKGGLSSRRTACGEPPAPITSPIPGPDDTGSSGSAPCLRR